MVASANYFQISAFYFPPQHVQKRHIPVPASLSQAQHVQIFLKPAFGHHPVDAAAVEGKCFDCRLRVVVVPGHAIVVEEGPTLVPVLAEPFGGFYGKVALVFPLHELLAKLSGILQMLDQMPLFQSVAIDRGDDSPEQLPEGRDEPFELLVERVFE